MYKIKQLFIIGLLASSINHNFTSIKANEITTSFDENVANISYFADQNSLTVSRLDTSVQIQLLNDTFTKTSPFSNDFKSKGYLNISENSVISSQENGIGVEITSVINVTENGLLPIQIVSNNTFINDLEYGSIKIVNEDNFQIGLITKPVLKNTNGDEITAQYVIRDGAVQIELLESIEENSQVIIIYTIYPQYKFSDFFYSSGWINRNGEISLSIEVNKNGNGWYIPSSSTDILDTSWSLLYYKHSGDQYWYNVQGLFHQYDCHYSFVWAIKTQWNIEPWRPNVGYSATVQAGCNP